MALDIQGKVALVTGGAGGIGFCFVKELLRNGLRGATLADVDSNLGAKALAEIEKEFGPNKAIFVKTDVTSYEQLKAAFKKTVETFKNIDIVGNIAGISNDKIWEKEVSINVNGVINGVLLGLEEYLPKYKSGPTAAIINMASMAAFSPSPILPVYTATKFAVLGLTYSWGDIKHYERTKVKVLALCPAVTDTPLLQQIRGKNLGEAYDEMWADRMATFKVLKPEDVARAMVNVVKNAETGTAWVVESEEPAPYKLIMPDRTTMQRFYLKQ